MARYPQFTLEEQFGCVLGFPYLDKEGTHILYPFRRLISWNYSGLPLPSGFCCWCVFGVDPYPNTFRLAGLSSSVPSFGESAQVA